MLNNTNDGAWTKRPFIKEDTPWLSKPDLSVIKFALTSSAQNGNATLRSSHSF